MTSSGRELLKWIALVLMTGDHVVKAFYGGYVPVISEAGRIAFPLFAVVMAYNLAQPGADLAKSFRRLLGWGAIAQPFHAAVFGYWLPLNVLLAFALAVAVVWSMRSRRWWILLVLAGPVPLLVDYQWAGIALVGAAWHWFSTRRDHVQAGASIVGLYCETLADWRDFPYWVYLAMCMVCAYNDSIWAVFALPTMLLADLYFAVPRTRWAFYGYYVGHLAVIAVAISVTRYAV